MAVLLFKRGISWTWGGSIISSHMTDPELIDKSIDYFSIDFCLFLFLLTKRAISSCSISLASLHLVMTFCVLCFYGLFVSLLALSFQQLSGPDFLSSLTSPDTQNFHNNDLLFLANCFWAWKSCIYLTESDLKPRAWALLLADKAINSMLENQCSSTPKIVNTIIINTVQNRATNERF